MASPQNSTAIISKFPFPTKLTHTHFTVWRSQIQSALIGHYLLGHFDGSRAPPPRTIVDAADNTEQVENPDYHQWYRQDQLILNTILGSYIEMIQPHISTVASSKEAWERLVILLTNKSRSRVMSLKERLINNQCGSRSVCEYLQEIRSISDDLTLVDQPLSKDNLVLHILASLGSEFKEVTAAIPVRDTSITFDELYDKLTDYEHH